MAENNQDYETQSFQQMILLSLKILVVFPSNFATMLHTLTQNEPDKLKESKQSWKSTVFGSTILLYKYKQANTL
jgi:hypothetical protein